MKLHHLLPVAALLAGTAQASGPQGNNTTCHTDVVSVQTTNWNTTVQVPKFDGDLGVLLQVRFRLQGDIFGSAAIESLDAGPSTVLTTYQAAITLTRPDNSVIVVATPNTQFNDNLTAFDGTIDFGGTSGITHGGINVNALEQKITTQPADLALFTGPGGNPGVIVLPIDAVGSSTASGSGNLITQFLTNAGASLEVCYIWGEDCNGNGIPDSRDVQLGTSNDADGNGVPDECEPGIRTFCDGDGSQNGGLDCPCGNNGGLGEGCENGTGQGGLLTATGNPSISNDTVSLTASQIPNGAPGFFMVAQQQPMNQANPGDGVLFSNGIRCIGGQSILRKVDNGGTIPVPNAPPLSVQLSLQPGQTTYFQYWYRNGGGPCQFGNLNATNAIEIVWGL